MKRIIISFILSILAISAFAQVILSEEQFAALPESAQTAIKTETKMHQISEYASWGEEIGVAIDGALDAVEEHVVNLAETPLGHTVIFLVCWKILAKDILRLIVGIVFTIILIWLLRRILKLHKDENFLKLKEDSQCINISCSWIGLAVTFIATMMIFFV